VPVGLLGVLVAAGVVVGDRQVERRVGVPGVDAQRRLEGPLRLLVLPLVVIDDAEHVVDVGERLVRLDDLGQVLLRQRVLLLQVVAAAEREGLLQLFVHVVVSSGDIGVYPARPRRALSWSRAPPEPLRAPRR